MAFEDPLRVCTESKRNGTAYLRGSPELPPPSSLPGINQLKESRRQAVIDMDALEIERRGILYAIGVCHAEVVIEVERPRPVRP